MKIKFLLILLYAFFSTLHLSGQGVGNNPLTIIWDEESETRIAPQGGYARIVCLEDGRHLAAFEDHRGNVVTSESNEDGSSWSESRVAIPFMMENGVRVNAVNAEICQLSDGSLVCGANYRPSEEGKADYSIAVSRSEDFGLTWSEPQIIFRADKYFTNGCWEPAFLELPDGTLQVYFANESPYRTSKEQEISMLTSSDGGRTWSDETVTVCFRKGCRDGMPVPVIFGDEIVVAIEDNADGQLKPYTVRTKIDNPWPKAVKGSSRNRDFALAEPMDTSTYAGAPYLMKLPSGEAVICYQTTEGRSSRWSLSTLEVAVGDCSARNFSGRTRPFEVPKNRCALWNSVMLWDENTVVAVTSTNKDGGPLAPVMIKGRITRTETY